MLREREVGFWKTGLQPSVFINLLLNFILQRATRMFVKTLANTQQNAANYTAEIRSIDRGYRASLR